MSLAHPAIRIPPRSVQAETLLGISMWHDPLVSRTLSSLQSCFFGAAFLSASLSAIVYPQTPALAAHRMPHTAKIYTPDLNVLQQAQAKALTTGDTSVIAATSRALATDILGRLALLAQLRDDTATAADLRKKARLLQGASEEAPSSTITGATTPPTPSTKSAATQPRPPTVSESDLKQLLAQTYNDLGTAEARQGQFAAAQTHFEEAVHSAAPTPTLLRNLGTAAFRVGDFATAVRAFSQYLQPTPLAAPITDPRSQLMYALSLFSTGDFATAARAFKPVETDAMRDPRSAYSWAFSLSHSGDPRQANAIAAQLSLQPLPPSVLSLVCHIFMDTESYGESAECFRKISAADPTFPLAHYQVAESLIRTDKPADAIPELRQELALSPDDPNVQYSLAFALLQTSNKPEALKLLSTITATHPDMAQPQYQYGKLLLESADLPGAISHLEQAEKADASLDYIHYQLQAAYRKAGRTADADREARLYREIKSRHRDAPSPR